MHAFKCYVNGIMYYMSSALQIRIPHHYINNVYGVKWRVISGEATKSTCVNSMPAVLYTMSNGPSADPGGILCAGLVVSSWIAYEIFESPERCMMNEVVCYLYAYRVHWLATGSARGSGSKWNSAPGQYIIKRNVCATKLTSLLRMRTRCLTGLGEGWGAEDCKKKKKKNRAGCRVVFFPSPFFGGILLNQSYFHTRWSVSFNHFTACGKWKHQG